MDRFWGGPPGESPIAALVRSLAEQIIVDHGVTDDGACRCCRGLWAVEVEHPCPATVRARRAVQVSRPPGGRREVGG